ncbi:hypothetical protein [Halosegnis sp.]|uniref:hypothetical protein n=1 Tax=Halosegnis sp. TaxID=2864959 RepID=UPI0035D3EF63
MDNLQLATFGLHGLVAVLLVGLAVGNYTNTGEPLSALAPLVIAAMIVGLGWTVARVVGRR